MTTNSRIKVTDVDYNQIRENLKTFLRSQSSLSSYDFDGSALSVLIDVLAYNTHYNALYTNMAINEMFLDSASKRSSVLSIANNYGYLPRSAKCSRALVDVTITDTTPGAPEYKVLERYTPFNASVNGAAYTFYTTKDYSARKNVSTYTFEDVSLYEGILQTFVFVCTEDEQKFILPNPNIDVETVMLTVRQNTNTLDYETYTYASSVIDLTATDTVYYLKELEDQTYELSFGTNNLGKPIAPGNVISIRYLVTNKTEADSASVFTYGGANLVGTISITTVSPSSGGADIETLDEIKKNVSRSFFTQNRAVTTDDYSTIIKSYYTDTKSVSVWGGEDNDPPQYGKVYIAVRPNSKPYLDETEKSYIKEYVLKNKNIVSITPEIVDPTYVEMQLNTTVYYNSNKTTRTQGEIIQAALTAITNYRDNTLNTFDGVFRFSKLSSLIDAVDQSIVSNITTFKLYTEIDPKYNVNAAYKFNLGNPIYSENVPEESFKSTGFYIDSSDRVYYLDDDGVSSVRLFYYNDVDGSKIVTNQSIGSIDYTLGIVTINGLNIKRLEDPNLFFIFKTQSYDVIPSRRQIIDIPNARITVNAIEDKISKGITSSIKNHTFTSSRS